MPETIVVAIDGSKQATSAADLGARLAEKFAAEIVLVHVLPDHMSAAEARGLVAGLAAPKRLPESARQEIARLSDIDRKSGAFVESMPPALISRAAMEAIANLILEDAETLARSRGAAKVSRVIRSGDPASGILDAARDTRASFIVMGKRGLGRLAGLLVGSVSQKVSALAECACVVVP
jgi:nucleotide-binding universal stress UspA family protein